MSGEHPAAGSRRMTKSEAEMGKAIAVLETRMDELRRDVGRLEGSTGEHSTLISAAAAKAGAALVKAKQALDEARRSIDTAPISITGTGPHGTVPNRNREVAVVGTATAGGAGLYALIEFIIRSLTQ